MAASKVSLSRIGIHTTEALTSASGNLLKTFLCTARAPLSRHMGHVGESKAKNRIFPLSVLNRSLSESREFSREIILFDWLQSLIPKTFRPLIFQLITSNGLSTYPPPGGHHLSIIFLLGFSTRTDNCQISFPFGFFPLS